MPKCHPVPAGFSVSPVTPSGITKKFSSSGPISHGDGVVRKIGQADTRPGRRKCAHGRKLSLCNLTLFFAPDRIVSGFKLQVSTYFKQVSSKIISIFNELIPYTQQVVLRTFLSLSQSNNCRLRCSEAWKIITGITVYIYVSRSRLVLKTLVLCLVSAII